MKVVEREPLVKAPCIQAAAPPSDYIIYVPTDLSHIFFLPYKPQLSKYSGMSDEGVIGYM